MKNGIENCVVTEGNLRAMKDLDNSDMWEFHVMETNGCFSGVQWMNVDIIQRFFKQQLPRYEEVKSVKFKKVQR
jgi:hypothetical protein